MLDDRATFTALADAGSFARAARRLGVARSTVMRRIDALEAELGVVLVHRVGRQVVLTDAGRRYAEALRPVLREIERVDQRLLADQGDIAGELRCWLPIIGTGPFPAIAAFQRAYPGVTVHVELGRDLRRPDLDAFDVAMQASFRINPALVSRTLMRVRMILVASKAYIEAHGQPLRLEALASHRSVCEIDADGKRMAWRTPDGRRVPMPPASITVNSVTHAYFFAQHGSGIARVPRPLVRAAIEQGTMVQVLPEIWTEVPVNLVFLPNPTPVVRRFVDFVVDSTLGDGHLGAPAR